MRKKSTELSCLGLCAPVLKSYQNYKASAMLLWIKYKKALLHCAEHVTNGKWEAGSTTKPYRGKGRYSSPVILSKCSFWILKSSSAIDIPKLFKVCHKKFYRQWNAPIDGVRDETCWAIFHWQRLGTPPPNTITSVWGSSGGVNTMSHPASEDNCFKLFLFPSPQNCKYIWIFKKFILLLLRLVQWQWLRIPDSPSEGQPRPLRAPL